MKFFYNLLLLIIATLRLSSGARKSFGELLVEFYFRHSILVLFSILGGIVITGVIATLLLTGPHMTHQDKFLASQSILPGVAEGTLPREEFPLWPEQEISTPDTVNESVLLAGQMGYRLYCQFCHGVEGDGDGPVGRSYIPKPANLQSGRIKDINDTTLYNIMLTGIGHEMTTVKDTLTILNRIVPLQYRWFIVKYVKSLGKNKCNHM